MILADTSIWVDHLRSKDELLAELLDGTQIVLHPFVIGELALGDLRQRATILASLQNLPQTSVATAAEVLIFVARHTLHRTGIGYVDAHLLAAAQLTGDSLIWTRDKRLRAAAERLRLAAPYR